MTEQEEFEFRLRLERERGSTRQDNLALAKQVVQERPNTLAGKLAMGSERGETFGQYAGRSLKEMAIPMATTAVGAMGGLPGAMAGSGLGELANQALGVYGKSVIPEANQIDVTRAGIATAAPVVIPAIAKGAQLVGKAGEKIGEKIFPTKMAEAWLKKTIGPYGDDIAAAINKPAPIKNYPQTAAEKLAGSEFGSVIQGHQAITARSPGGISTEFGKLSKYQDTILKEAAKNRDLATQPLRDQALDAAQGKFGVKAKAILDYVNKKLKTPEVKGSPSESEKVFKGIKRFLEQNTDEYGRIDVRTLYQYEKDGVNRVIEKIVGQTDPHGALKFKTKNLAGFKQQIDDTLDAASKGAWRKYLGEYASQSKDIETLQKAKELMYQPAQKTDLRGGVDLGTSAAHQILPPWLSRPITFTRWGAERIGEMMEPRIDRYMANVYQHPDMLLKFLGSQAGTAKQKAMAQEILKRYAPIAAGASTQMQP